MKLVTIHIPSKTSVIDQKTINRMQGISCKVYKMVFVNQVRHIDSAALCR